VDPASLQAPANATVLDRVHHGGLLAAAEVVVTHAGLGTVAAALGHGVPLVCAPIGRDQHLNAERVAALGAGVVVEDGTDPTQLARAVETVLAEGSFREAARSVAELSRQAGEVKAVVADLEQAAREAE